MKYRSTRGGERGLSFQQALFSGYAVDGGLYWPERLPCLSESRLQSLSLLNYPTLLIELLSLFIDSSEISTPDLQSMVIRAYSNFEMSDVVTVRSLSDNLDVLELFHGPTHTFKDLAMAIVAQMYEHFLARSKEHKTVLVGTSGDTGGSAIAAMGNLAHVDLIVLYPMNKVTNVQELEMTRRLAPNVHVFGVSGTSDELDVPIRRAFEKERGWTNVYNLTSINSINIVRILVQTAHAFYAALQHQFDGDNDHVVELVYPTGAGGNLSGAILASLMGVSLRCVVCVTQPVIHTLINDSTLKMSGSKEKEVKSTLACAIDIGAPYNIERWIHMAAEQDVEVTKDIMEKEGQLATNVQQNLNKVIKESHLVSNEAIKIAIQECFQEHNYKLCPHTATAYDYHLRNPTYKGRRVIVATGSPLKFSEALRASGVAEEYSQHTEELSSMDDCSVPMKREEDWLMVLHNKLIEIHNKRQEAIN